MVSKVAVGVDGSATAAEAVRMAAELARRFDAELVLLSAFQESRSTSNRPVDDAVELQWATSTSARVRETLARTEAELRADGLECRTLVDEGDAGEVLVRLAEECGADVLVVGNKGMQRRVLGSVPNTVTHRAACSVFVVKTT
jgi:nucleotide-binding universal stress UspA family protein